MGIMKWFWNPPAVCVMVFVHHEICTLEHTALFPSQCTHGCMYEFMYAVLHSWQIFTLNTEQTKSLVWSDLKYIFYELCQCICWYTHSPPRPSFCFSDYLDLCTKAKQFSNSWGSIFPLPIRFHCRAIRLTLTLGGSAMTPRRSAVLCSCHEAGVTKVFFFYKKLTVFEIMNMQWLSLVLKLQSRGWHPPTRTLCSCRTG